MNVKVAHDEQSSWYCHGAYVVQFGECDLNWSGVMLTLCCDHEGHFKDEGQGHHP